MQQLNIFINIFIKIKIIIEVIVDHHQNEKGLFIIKNLLLHFLLKFLLCYYNFLIKIKK